MPLTTQAAAIVAAITVLFGLLLTGGPAAAHDKKWCAHDTLTGKVECAATTKQLRKKACHVNTPLHPCAVWRHRH